ATRGPYVGRARAEGQRVGHRRTVHRDEGTDRRLLHRRRRGQGGSDPPGGRMAVGTPRHHRGATARRGVADRNAVRVKEKLFADTPLRRNRMTSLAEIGRVPLRATTALTAVLALTIPGATIAQELAPPPASRVVPVVDTIHGVAVPDPYRWLEDGESEETRAWVTAQNAYAERIVGNPPVRAWLARRLAELSEPHDVGSPRRAGDYEYFTLRRAGEEVAAVYRRPAPARGDRTPIDPAGEYEKVLDPLQWRE